MCNPLNILSCASAIAPFLVMVEIEVKQVKKNVQLGAQPTDYVASCLQGEISGTFGSIKAMDFGVEMLKWGGKRENSLRKERRRVVVVEDKQESKIRTLENKVKDLKTKKSEVLKLVSEAENNVEAIIPVVKDWLQNVDVLKKEADEVLEGATNSEMQCLFLRCPNLKTRYSLGRKATKKTAEVAKLQVEGTFQKVGEPKPPVQTPYQNPGDFGAFDTRISIKKEIMDALKDKDSIIGICGMGGVDVSHDSDVTKIQDQLAGKLGLKIQDIADKYERAERLRERIGGDNSKSILIILDDVWGDTELKKIGIPSTGYDKELKILLTSRVEDVCRNMGAQRIFRVGLLNEKESWELFKEKAEISDDATGFIKDTAEQIAMGCDGLPLALVIVGKALSKKAEHAWKNALEELRNSTVSNINGVQKLYSRIELSYNYLESDEAKSLLLLCSLYAEDKTIVIEDLVRYARGLELFRGTTTLITTRDRVNTIVNHLKSCYLLLSAEDEENVRLHDVVRNVCLQIASRDKHVYMSEHTGLKEWPEHDNNESYGAICLSSNELNHLPSGLEYPNLKFLGVTCRQQSLDIAVDFFANMKDLRVLDFTLMTIQIPSSIQLLTNLRTLCLNHCIIKIQISTFGNLKKLEVLNLFDSDLDHFPDDIAELSNLRSLDLRFTPSSRYCSLPPGILSKLKKLEELYMGVIRLRDDELEQRGYIIEEISSLTRLDTFQISTNDSQFLLQIFNILSIEKLDRFYVQLADYEHARDEIMDYYYFRRRLHICGITYASMLSQPAIDSLMRRSDVLHIEMERIMKRENVLDIDGFSGNHPTGAFDRLQEIYLRDIRDIKHLWRGVIKPPSLHNLLTLNVESCRSLKSLFSESGALCMVNLQSLRICGCGMLEEIVSMDTEQNEIVQVLEFPKLKEINLSELRNLKSFRYRSESNNLSQQIFEQVTLPNLEMLSMNKLGCTIKILDELRQIRSRKLRGLNLAFLEDASILFDFEYLFTPSMANSLVALKGLWVFGCEAIEEIIGKEEESNTSKIEIMEEQTTSRIVFPKLKIITLRRLDRFKMLSSQNCELLFPSLDYLNIQHCPVIIKLCSRELLSAPKLDKAHYRHERATNSLILPIVLRIQVQTRKAKVHGIGVGGATYWLFYLEFRTKMFVVSVVWSNLYPKAFLCFGKLQWAECYLVMRFLEQVAIDVSKDSRYASKMHM
ncbi:unnamed protein product [Fraxinus pennsylvanica]|uniref:NB-ARC domain-containing protein n=1 Tax=Fraxinus pennsylvanica TaxID=56036 RepID=A0AAD1ZZ19_9LAMI|nr:unnamed protein product [Fraxinus pennsylvanica]